MCAECGYVLFGRLLQIICIPNSRTTCYSTISQHHKRSSTSERMMRIIMTDDPTGNSTPVHVHFLPTRLPAPGTSPGWVYKILVRASRKHIVPRRHHHVRAARDAARVVAHACRGRAARRQSFNCLMSAYSVGCSHLEITE